jgi:hypothetical protein
MMGVFRPLFRIKGATTLEIRFIYECVRVRPITANKYITACNINEAPKAVAGCVLRQTANGCYSM